EAIFAKLAAGRSRLEGIKEAMGEIVHPLIGSTLTPVVVFLPLSFLEGIAGVFFRALALTMVVALLTSLVLAITLTPSLAAWFIRLRPREQARQSETRAVTSGFLLRRVIRGYEAAVRLALRHGRLTLLTCGGVLLAGVGLYGQLQSDFLPAMDEGGFVLDYFTPWGTSLTETDRQLVQAEI